MTSVHAWKYAVLDHADPSRRKALEASARYPQAIGLGKGETDKLAGRRARLFMAGVSRKEILFLKPGERGDE